jgi:hypothetical protein
MLLEGLLGAAKGAGEATNAIGEDVRRQLSRKAMLQAEEEMRRRLGQEQDERALERQREQQGFLGAQNEQNRNTRYNIAEQNRLSREKVAKMQVDLQQKQASATLSKAEAAKTKTQVDAANKAAKILEAGGTTDEANMVLEAAGLPRIEKYTIKEEKSGFLGWGAEPAEYGYREEGSGINNDIDALYAAGKESTSGKPTKPGGKEYEGPGAIAVRGQRGVDAGATVDAAAQEETRSVDAAEKSRQAAVPQPGLLSAAGSDLGDPAEWNVQKQAGQYFIITKDGPRKMTEAEIAQWKQATGAKRGK